MLLMWRPQFKKENNNKTCNSGIISFIYSFLYRENRCSLKTGRCVPSDLSGGNFSPPTGRPISGPEGAREQPKEKGLRRHLCVRGG